VGANKNPLSLFKGERGDLPWYHLGSLQTQRTQVRCNGQPRTSSQATFGSTCRERLTPGDLSSLSADCSLLLLICAVESRLLWRL
jgi:hypothetical protein